jgi:hypothetical protein
MAPASAQSVYGSIFGTVSDNTGAVIPDAAISVTSATKNTTVSVTSNGSGDYSVPHLIPDTYNIRVVAKGFKPFETKGIAVLADTSPRIDPTLEVGSDTGTTVEVSAEAVPQLKTDRADVSIVFNQQQVSSLPIGDQNFTNLQLAVPGAQKLGWSHAADENPQDSKQIMVNGQAFAGTAFELDGTDNQDPILGIIVINPTMDAVTETKITTQNFDAELGKAVSAVVTAQTRSGSNAFHGAVYDYRTGNANLARDPFQQAPESITKAQGLPNSVPPGLKNRFGGAIGGRIIRDKLFFFGSYEGQRQKVGTSAKDTLPTELLMESCLGNRVGPSGIAGCDFSEYKTQLGAAGIIYDNRIPGISTAFPGNVIPKALLSPQTLNLLKYLEPFSKGIGLGSVGNLNGLDSNFNGSGTGLFNGDQWTVRGDWTLNEKMHAFGRFSRFTDTLSGKVMFGDAGGPGFGIGNYGGNSSGANDSTAAGMDIAINPSLLTDFRLGYYRYNVIDSKHDQNVQFANTLGIPGINMGDYFTGGSPGFVPTNLPGGSGGTQGTAYGDGLNVNRCNCPLTQKEDQYQIVNNWTKVLGAHSVKVGVDLRYARNLRVPSDTDRAGQLNFTAGSTSNPAASTQGGLGLATMMLGQVTSFGRYVSTSTNAKEFQKRTFFYGQDTWRINRKLTANIGLRWELYFPEKVNADGNGSLLNLNDGYLHIAGVGGVDSAMDSTIEKKNLFAPRIGLAYQLNDKTVVRAGYGRSFDIGIFGSIFGHVVTQNLPVLTNQSVNAPNTTSPAFTLAQGPPAPTPIPVPSNGLLPNPGYAVNSRARPFPLRFPTIDAWNAAFQRAITPNLTMTVAYVGNKGTHTMGDSSGNQTNWNEAAINLPGANSPTGQALHYDPTVPQNKISANGGVATQNYLRRYFGTSLAACKDPLYPSLANLRKLAGDPNGYLQAGACGWTSDLQYYVDNLNTSFNALQVTLAQGMWKGWAYTANYQWASAFAVNTGFSSWDPKAARGRDSNVRLQQLTWFGSYDLPLGHGKPYASSSRALDLLLGGFQLSGVVDWAGGTPFTLNYNEAGSNVPGSAPSYPSYTHGGHMKTSLTSFKAGSNGTGSRTYYTKQVDNLITPKVTNGLFKNPGLDTIGDVGRNTYLGPSFFNSDLAVTKAFTIHEQWVAKFRMDAFNAFNHINPGNPNGNIESDGTITGQGPGGSTRQLVFSLRLQF